jgi:hypothetical protein
MPFLVYCASGDLLSHAEQRRGIEGSPVRAIQRVSSIETIARLHLFPTPAIFLFRKFRVGNLQGIKGRLKRFLIISSGERGNDTTRAERFDRLRTCILLFGTIFFHASPLPTW